MRGHIYQILYKSILREKVRPGRLNRGVFHATNDRLFFATRSEGGVWQDSGSRYGEAAFIYMTHSTVVITCKSARHIARKEKSCAESAPPQNRGVMRPRIEVHCGIPLSGPMGVALVLIYPCGKAWNSPPFPSRFIVSDRAVGREGELAHDKGYYHSCLGRSRKLAFGHTRRLSRSRGALSPAGP